MRWGDVLIAGLWAGFLGAVVWTIVQLVGWLRARGHDAERARRHRKRFWLGLGLVVLSIAAAVTAFAISFSNAFGAAVGKAVRGD